MQHTKEQIEELQKQAKNSTIVINNIKKSMDKRVLDINNLYTNINNIYMDTNNIFNTVSNNYSEIQNIRDETIRYAAETRENMDERMKQIQRMENVLFDIYVNFDGSSDSNSFKKVVEKLSDEGFRICNSNVMDNVEVDKNEVVYYSLSYKSKATEIRDILKKDGYKNIEEKFINNKDRGTRDLSLKLKGTN